MISRSAITSASGAAGYYSQTSAAAEYYSGEAIPSAWHGKGAEMLGLAGRVSEKDLTTILEGRLTDATGPRKLGRTKVDKETGERTRDHRAGWDFTISASKSMSLAALAIDDPRLNATATAAHRAGVEASLQFFEREGGQYREGGETKNGSLVVATHEHVLSRAGDSQLHTHALLANICMDSEGKAHSLAERDIFRLRRAADHIYHSTVAQHMERAGHAMEFSKEGAAELVGISPDQRMEFSARRQQLLAELAARGIDPSQASAEQRNILNLSTRQDKEFLESREANKERWADEVQAAGIATPAPDKAIAAEARQIDGEAQARRAVEQAMKHLGEREAVFTRIGLLKQAARFNQGKADQVQIEATITEKERSGELLRDAGGNRYTTSAELSRVQAIGQALEAGKGAHEAVMTAPQFDAALQKFEELKGFALSDEQRAAARMILVGDDQFQAVQGLAGTGKTTLLSFVREAAEAQGWKIVGHSNGASQAQTLESESGIASTTTARHLIEAGRELAKNDAPPPQPRRELRVMDEASMADSRE
uniref:MobF family relaxase n=1 Tax=Acidocella sp. TaxID=50710 RepID=UPI002602D1BF